MSWKHAARLAPLALLGVFGCQPRVIDALQLPTETDGSSPDGQQADVVDVQHEGGPQGTALAYYSFDEGTGSVVHDDSSHGHDGTLLGGAWTTAGRFGGAIRFDAFDGGAAEAVLVDPFPQPVTDWSVSLWLLVKGSDLTDVSTVLSTEITFTGGWEVNLQPNDATFGNVQFAFWGGTQYALASCNCITLGSWTHIVAVVDGAALTIRLFQDGVAAASGPVVGTFLLGNPYLYMGRWGGTGRPLVGVLDEVAIFDRALSEADIAKLYAGVVP
jgi:hypothetical protein